MTDATRGYLRRWGALSAAAKRFLVHVGLMTVSLAIIELFFNLAILAQGYSRADLGFLNLVAVWSSVAFSLPLWWLVTRIGFKASLLIHAAVQALAVSVYALAPSLVALIAAAGVAGASAVLYQVSAAPLMMRHSDAATRDYVFSASAGLTIAISGLGSLFAGSMPQVFARFLQVGAESAPAYQATFGVAVVGLLVSMLPLVRMKDNERAPAEAVVVESEAKPAPARPGYWTLLRNPLPLLGLLLAPCLISIGAALLLPYLNLFFKQQFAVSDAVLGLIFAMLNISTGAAVLLGPALSARIGPIRTVALAQALSIPFLLVMGFVPLLAVAVAAGAIRSALFNMARPLYDAFAMERTDEALRPTVIGMIGGASTVGYLFAPALSVQVQERFGFGPLFIATTLCYVLATLVIAVLFIRSSRPAA